MIKLKFKNHLRSGLDPMPVMGRDAFIALADEWDKYLQSKGLYGAASIPPFRKNHHLTTDIGLMHGRRGQGAGVTYLASARGWKVDSKYNKDPENYFTGDNNDKGNKYWAFKGIDQLKECQLSTNFMFLSIGEEDGASKKSTWRLDDVLKNYSVSEAEITDVLRKMIYSRSALVSRDLFGNFPNLKTLL